MEENRLHLLPFLLLCGLCVGCSADGSTQVKLLSNQTERSPAAKRSFIDYLLLFANFYIQSTKPEAIPGILASLDADSILKVTGQLNDPLKMKVMNSLNSTDIMDLMDKMTPEQKAELLGYLPASAVVRVADVLDSQELGSVLTSLPVESIVTLTETLNDTQNYEVISSLSPEGIVNLTETMNETQNYQVISRLPPEGIVGVIRRLSKSQAMQVLSRLPTEGILNITETLSQDQLAELLDALPSSGVLQLLSEFPSDGITALVSKLPPAALKNLTMSFSPAQLSKLLVILPPDAVMKVTNALNVDELSKVLTDVSPESLLNLTTVLPRDDLMRILKFVKPESIVSVIKSLDQVQVMTLVSQIPSTGLGELLVSLPAPDVVELLNDLPESSVGDIVVSLESVHLEKLLTSLPVGVVAHLTRSLNPMQVSLLVNRLSAESLLNLTESLPKEAVGQLLGSVSSQALQNLTESLHPAELVALLKVLTPSTIGGLLKSFPADAVGILIHELPVDMVSSLVTTLSANLTNELLGQWPDDIIQYITGMLNISEMAGLVGKLSPAAIVKIAQILPSKQLGDILAALPVDLLDDITQALKSTQLQILLTHIPTSGQAALISKLPGQALDGLLGKIPPQVLGSLVSNLPTALLANLTTILSPASLTDVLMTVSNTTLSRLLSTFPREGLGSLIARLSPSMLVHLTDILPPEQLAETLTSLSPAALSGVLSKYPQSSLAGLISTLQQTPAALLNLTMSLPRDALATILSNLPKDQLVSLLKSFPQTAVNNLVPKIPVDLLLNLTKDLPGTFITNLSLQTVLNILFQIPGEKLLNIINSVLPGGPLSLLQLIPRDVMSGIFKTVTPDQVEAIIKLIPPDQLQGIIRSLLPDLLTGLTQGSSADLENILLPALDSVTQMLGGMSAQQTHQILSQLRPVIKAVLPAISQAVPALLADLVTSDDGDEAGLGDMLNGLVVAVVDSVPVSSLLDLAAPLLPEIPRMLANSIDDLGAALLSQDAEKDDRLKQCVQDLGFYLNDLANGTDWAVNMFDASGKPSRGLLRGNTHLHGNYDQCVAIGHVQRYLAPNSTTGRNEREIKGGYCGIELILPAGVVPPVPAKGILPDIVTEIYLCLPYSCRAKSLWKLISAVNLPLNISVPRVSCQGENTLAEDGAAITTISILAVLGALVVLGTTLDLIRQRKQDQSTNDDEPSVDLVKSEVNGGFELQEKDPDIITVDVGGGELMTSFRTKNGAAGSQTEEQYMPTEVDDEDEVECLEGSVIARALAAFSLPVSTERVLGLDDVTDSITCLHGIRALSLYWVIVGHTFLFTARHFENPLGAAESLETLVGQMIVHASLGVDSFLVISGCLTAVLFLREVKKEGGVTTRNLLSYFAHRYLRLTPAYAVVIMVSTCLLPYLFDGPNWQRESRQYFSSCENYWWANLLYINNFYKSYDEQCVPWGWYLSVDMQLHWILAPFVLIAFAKGLKALPSLLIGGLVAMQIVLTVYFENNVNGDYLRNADAYGWEIFQKPYTRVAPFALGLGLGYLLSRVKGRIGISTGGIVVGWLMSIGAIVTAVLVKYDENHVMLDQPFHWPEGVRAVHEAMYRPIFSMALCWIILMCATGNGGFINSMLSWKALLPFSRLAFCMYLLHPVVILADMWRTRVPLFFSVSYVLQRASGYILLSGIFAYFLSVTVETPIAALERMLLKRQGSTFTSEIN